MIETRLSVRLSPDQLHLWVCLPETIQDPSLLQRYLDLLNPEEKVQQKRFLRPSDRHRYLITRALIRTTLSKYLPRPPKDWRFVFNQYGKPSIDPAQQDIPLSFNISHSKDMIVCLVGLDLELGVDVEMITRKVSFEMLAEYNFAKGEALHIASHTTDEQKREHFFRYWTLKEAYIKARGMGLALPLDQFSFHRTSPPNIEIDFLPPLEDTPSDWQFGLYTPSPEHLIATAIHRRKRPPFKLKTFSAIPFLREDIYELPVLAETR